MLSMASHLFGLSRIIRLLGVLAFLSGTPGWGQERTDSPSSVSPPVFQPDETQHGFAKFETISDFTDDDIAAPYDSYSHSPDLPAKDERPKGLFESLNFAESVEEDSTLRRGHILVPIHARDSFPQDTKAVHLVFKVFKHYAPYQVIGRLFPERVEGLDADQWLEEDIADLALEDESGYLKFFPASGIWQPGQYRVDLYVGYVVNSANKMGAMRFTITPSLSSSSSTTSPASP